MRTKKEHANLEKVELDIQKSTEEITQLKLKCQSIKEQISYQFKAYHLLEETDYTNNDALMQYKILLKLIEEYVIDEDAKSAISDAIEPVKKACSILEAGKKGEDATFEAMRLLGPKIKYLKNARFIYDEVDVEQDLIVIASTGIFTIEVKNWNRNGILNAKGILEQEGGRKADIVGQIRRHRNCLERIINENVQMNKKLGRNIEVYPIILWQNWESIITDHFKKIPICYINDLEYEINNTQKYNDCFSRYDIDLIYNFLQSVQCRQRKYPLQVDKEICQTIVFYATFQYIKLISSEIKKLNKLKEEEKSLKDIIDRKENHSAKYYIKKFYGKTIEPVVRFKKEL